jgi:hypothetical protein
VDDLSARQAAYAWTVTNGLENAEGRLDVLAWRELIRVLQEKEGSYDGKGASKME